MADEVGAGLHSTGSWRSSVCWTVTLVMVGPVGVASLTFGGDYGRHRERSRTGLETNSIRSRSRQGGVRRRRRLLLVLATISLIPAPDEEGDLHNPPQLGPAYPQPMLRAPVLDLQGRGPLGLGARCR